MAIKISNTTVIDDTRKLVNIAEATTNSLQVGSSATATQNFVLAVPATPNGTIKLARGNQGATTQDVFTVDAGGALTVSNAAVLAGTATLSGAATFNSTATFGGVATFNNSTTFSDQQVSRLMLRDAGSVFIDKGTSSGTVTFDYSQGSHQRLQVGGATTIAFSNFPPIANLGCILLELVNAGSATVTFPTINWVQVNGTFTTNISTYLTNIGRNALQTTGTDFAVIWTRDGGTTVYGKLL